MINNKPIHKPANNKAIAEMLKNSKPLSVNELANRFEISDPTRAPIEPPAIITP
ncbi:MAG: DeoR family transcriptional regulator [SAR86 cluster bacterium]|uniref:DeoR family transcriptional regulator n=1 Tax=SAR86 cluster bacterium TaxID=2030880 RepID=A0A937M2C5_9GAMM|nr:DeoR family transcriptional regulator [SAR86 cluster bacterium]